MKRSTIIELIAYLFTILFLYTGISKLMDYDIAKEQIALTPLLAPVASIIVIVLPITEIIISVLLFISSTRKYGLWASFGLMTAFTGYVMYILNYNNRLPCTCGGVLEAMTWPEHLVFNISLIILSSIALFMNRRGHFLPQKATK
jgi:uncharacterized membrane protein YphA (DoxX/SURF4 family)